ncbi:hypothetical protein [Mucilaginibacter sp. OK283]|uniref:hypothetical protein n=1 Tax=Mucilaginibacter sp. OK283 TaxID=1881049 RepID=UPI0008C91F81|nr:hypothetical protein [Mucilaginibacter sp. OK283]SEO81092.1 hypothetical protein SAMN05428947_104175 [Mucilaginibacter sp. OK283]
MGCIWESTENTQIKPDAPNATVIFNLISHISNLSQRTPPVEAAPGYPLILREALFTGRYPFLSFTRAAGIQKHPDEIEHPGVAYLFCENTVGINYKHGRSKSETFEQRKVRDNRGLNR